MNDTAHPDSAPPRLTFRPDLISRILSGDAVVARPFNTPQAPARPPAIAWIHDEVTCGTEASFRELVTLKHMSVVDVAEGYARQARMYGRVCLPSRLADKDLHMDLYGRTCQIIDDPINPGSERYQQARAGVPYPRGTRAQRRRTATARVQARRRHHRTLTSWFRTFLDAGPDAVDSVPAGPYDPPRGAWTGLTVAEAVAAMDAFGDGPADFDPLAGGHGVGDV